MLRVSLLIGKTVRGTVTVSETRYALTL